MFRRTPAVGLVVLCLIAALGGCARRSANAVQLPGAPVAAAKSEKSSRAGAAARKMRDAIKSLKNKIGATDSAAAAGEQEPGTVSPEASAVPNATGAADANSGQVGTTGVLSVETRHPSPPGTGVSPGTGGSSPPRGRLLSRAGRAVRHVGGGGWGSVLALCVLALALVAAALAVRRSRHHA